MTLRVGPRRLAFVASLGFMLLQAAWILVMPPYAGIDEFDHAFRANSVAEGHIHVAPHTLPRALARGDLIPVRADIAAAAESACYRLPYTGPFNCRAARPLVDGNVLIASGAARYNPSFYWLVGKVALPWHGDSALYIMRACAGLLCAALFGFSVFMTAGWARTNWPLIAIALTALPTTVYSSSLAAPNGVEMVAGLAVWAALFNVMFSAYRTTLAYAGLAVSAAILVNAHSLGIAWLLLSLVGCMLLSGPRFFISVLRPRQILDWIILTCSVVAIACQGVWLLVARTNDPYSADATFTGNVWSLLPRQMMLWPLQAIAAFPFRDEPAPTVVYAIGVITLGSFALLALRASGKQPRTLVAIGFVVAASYAVPIALSVASFSRLGFAWQGRYGMPFTVGLLLIFGVALDNTGRRLPSVGVVVLVAAWMAMYLVSQLNVLHNNRNARWVIEAHNWSPPMPSVIVILVLLSAVAWAMTAMSHQARRAPDSSLLPPDGITV